MSRRMAYQYQHVKRNPKLARAILKSFARQICTTDSDKSLYADIRAHNDDVSEKTILMLLEDYILLKKLPLGILISEVKQQLELLLKKQ